METRNDSLRRQARKVFALLAVTAALCQPGVANAQQAGVKTFTPKGNPMVTDKFTADPATLVHDGTLYLYTGHDEADDQQMFNITEWLCYSTTDMKTWTDHGGVLKPTVIDPPKPPSETSCPLLRRSRHLSHIVWASSPCEKDGN